MTRILLMSTIVILSLNSCGLFSSRELDFNSREGVKFSEYDSITLAKRARQENKPLFVVAYANYCSLCKKMEKDIFPDLAIGNIFNNNFISAKVNVDSEAGKKLESSYDISSVPTLLFFDAEGTFIKKVAGFQNKEDLKLLAKDVSKK